jgi:hypothetical protein
MVVYIRVFVASWRVHAEINDKLKKGKDIYIEKEKKKFFS